MRDAAPKKLTKRQRAKLIDASTRTWVEALDEETLLALHDLTHEVMDVRGKVATEALRAAIAKEGS